MKIKTSSILFAIFAWSLLILRFGYQYGTGDQVELLPYVLYLNDPSLYAHDFFIQGLHAQQPNERTVMAHLLLPFVNHLEVVCLLLHFLVTVVLVLGIEQMALRFVRNKYTAWLIVLTALIPLNDFTLGNVELYSECFQASALATAIIVWGINLFLDKRYTLASVLMSVASIIQILDGLNVMVLLSLVLLIYTMQHKVNVKQFVTFIGIYAATAVVYMVMILKAKGGEGNLSNEQLFSILFEFRHPHHFIFSTFSKLKVAVFFTLSGIGLLYFYRRSTALFYFIATGLAGVIIYAVITDIFHTIFIANFQFYKVTQWMKLLGVIAVFAYLESLIGEYKTFRLPVWLERSKLIAGTAMCFAIIVFFADKLPYKVPYQILGLKERDDAITICQQIKAVTPKEAVFVQTFDDTALKFYGQRSSYVEFKANVRHKSFVGEWYNRIQQVYGISGKAGKSGFALRDEADTNFCNAEVVRLKGLGVSHILTKKDCPLPQGILILQNNTYAVYQL